MPAPNAPSARVTVGGTMSPSARLRHQVRRVLALPERAVGKIVERTLAADRLVHTGQGLRAVGHRAEEGCVRSGDDPALGGQLPALEEPERGAAIEAGHPTSVRPILDAWRDVLR